MSDLQPNGAIVQFDGVERRLIWDYGVIEKVQEIYGGHPYTAIMDIFWEGVDETTKQKIFHYQAKPVIDLMHLLINNEVAREKFFEGSSAKKTYTREQIGMIINRINAKEIVQALVDSWKDSMPQPDDDEENEEDSKNAKSGKLQN